jgi:hypothetical protein
MFGFKNPLNAMQILWISKQTRILSEILLTRALQIS